MTPRRTLGFVPDDTDDLQRARQYAREQAAEAAEYRLRVKHLERENAKLLRRLNKVYRSWTWRAGRIVLFPYHGALWVLTKVKRSRGR
jgi:hypothetical protein